MTDFKDLRLSKNLQAAVDAMGFEEPTPIQASAIPLALKGKDLIGQARTGTGKTAAFGLPIIEHLSPGSQSPQALVVAPTRELAIQVSEELNRIGQFKGIIALPVYGGQDIGRQIKSLRNKPHIIVGTPGRLLDHIRRRTLRLDQVTHVVLDEADEMLNMGFIEDVEEILSHTPEKRQTMLFSATMPPPIKKLAVRFMKQPETIQTQSQQVTVPAIRQSYVQVAEQQKFDTLCRLLDMHPPELALIFCRTKRRVDDVAEGLVKRSYMAGAIHGDMPQAKREAVLEKFRKGKIDILVATDVAARGWDVAGISHIYNFDVPQDSNSYVHRIGRTGRAGKSGTALTLITHRERYHLRQIEQQTGSHIKPIQPPSSDDALRSQQQKVADKILAAAQKGPGESYRDMARRLLADSPPDLVLAAALKMLTREPQAAPVTIDVERRQNAPRRKPGGHRSRRR